LCVGERCYSATFLAKIRQFLPVLQSSTVSGA